MKKKSSLITTLVAVILIITTSAFPALANGGKAVTPSVTTSVNQIADAEQAINLIEQNNFIGVNTNGTSFIKDEANNYIDANTMSQIKIGMDRINQQLMLGVLVRDKVTNEIRKADNTVESMSVTADITGTYIWHWYGFDFIMEAYSSNLFSSELYYQAGAIALGALPFYAVPGIVAVAAGSVAAITMMAANAGTGGSNGRGSIAYFLGDPSWAQLTHVDVR